MNELVALVEKWEGRARRAFHDAANEPDAMGKRLIEHGAMCYFNCAQELKEALPLSAPATSAAQLSTKKHQAETHHPDDEIR